VGASRGNGNSLRTGNFRDFPAVPPLKSRKSTGFRRFAVREQGIFRGRQAISGDPQGIFRARLARAAATPDCAAEIRLLHLQRDLQQNRRVRFVIAGPSLQRSVAHHLKYQAGFR
jgi:hypothetical protein